MATLKISRSKLELFTKCKRCFYLDVRFGVKQPSMPAFSLNNAVDELFKKEFDIYREKGTPHPIMVAYNIHAVPFKHPKLDIWRNAFKGVEYYDKENDITLFGGVDDVWVSDDEELHVVDYKATSKDETPKKLAGWQDSYKRQVEVYQFLFRNNGFSVSPIAYFVYANADKKKSSFDNTLAFETVVIPHEGDDSWIPEALAAVRKCFDSDDIPEIGKNWKDDACEHCKYRESAGSSFRDHVHATRK